MEETKRRACRLIAGAAISALLLSAVSGCEPGDLPSNLPSGLPTVLPTDLPTVRPTVPHTTRTEVVTRTATHRVSPSSGESPVAEEPMDSDSFSGWLWLLIAAIVILAVTLVWVFTEPGRKWNKRFSRATTEARWADNEVIPEVLASPNADEAAAIWQSARQRLQAAVDDLHVLGGADVNRSRRDRATRLGLALTNLVGAVDAELSAGSGAGDLRGAMARLESARTALRTELDGKNQEKKH